MATLYPEELNKIEGVLERAALLNCRSASVQLNRGGLGWIDARWSSVDGPTIEVTVYDEKGVRVHQHGFDNMDQLLAYYGTEAE